MTKQFNVRLPDHSQKQLDEMLTATGMTVTQIIIMLIDRGHRQIVEPTPEEYEKYIDQKTPVQE